MSKVLFNQEGLDKKREEITSLPEDQLRAQLKEIRFNTRKWTIENFELNEDQLDYFNQMPDEMVAQLGLNTAICFDYDLKLTLEVPDVSSQSTARIRICKNTDVRGQVRGHWSEGESPKIDSWSVTVGFSF